jgi:hypothetical protein
MLKFHPDDTDGTVYMQEEIKLLEFSNILGKLESEVYDYSTAVLKIRNPVPIKDDRKKPIGFATVYLEGNTLKAQCSIATDCPERLHIENGMNLDLHPHGFLAFEEEIGQGVGSMDFAGRKKKVKDLFILSISLTNIRPKNGQSAILKGW